MSDLPFAPVAAGIAERLFRAVDVEGKISRALDALGPLGERDVVLLDGAPRLRVPQLLELGARLTIVDRADAIDPGVVRASGSEPADAADSSPGPVRFVAGTPLATGLSDASVDVVLAMWSAMAGPCPAEVAEADRILRPGGRLLVLHDYGRDDLDPIRGAVASAEIVRWSRRDGWYLAHGFRIHVIHAFWTFASVEEAADVLGEGFGAPGLAVVGRLHRPRVAHNVAIYHRSRGDGPTAGRQTADRGAGVERGPGPAERATDVAAAGDPAEGRA